jgi:mono/diheme cytochrome c family protein
MRKILVAGLAIAGLLAAIVAASSEESAFSPLALQGRALAARMCAPCHATGRSGSSPHTGAPAFRTLSRRVDLDTFPNRLREGLTSGHPDMPTFRFSRDDARALTAYLRAIQGP